MPAETVAVSDEMTLAELDAAAANLGIESPDKIRPKAALIAAITERQAALAGS